MAKKIINHIPSLSSLLLSGLVFATSTSCDGCKQENTITATNTDTETGTSKKETGTQKEEPKGEVASAFSVASREEREAVARMFDVIVSKKKNLEQLRTPIYSVDPDKLESASKADIKKMATDVCLGLAQAPFYPGSTLEAFGNLVWDSNLPHKAAKALAVNYLAGLFKPVVEVAEGFEDMRQTADFGSVDTYTKQLTELDQQLDDALKLSKTFAMANDSGAFKTTKEFLSFFTDDKGTAKALLARKLNQVYIDSAALSEEEKKQRTAAIESTWKVDEIDRNLPSVPAIPDSQGMLHNLTFAQVLFTIFCSRDEASQRPGDIFFLKRADTSSKKSAAKFKVIKEEFSQLVKQKVTLSDEDFAAYLGTRIVEDDVLKKLFPIVDVSSETECGKLIGAVTKIRTNSEKAQQLDSKFDDKVAANLRGLVVGLFPKVSFDVNGNNLRAVNSKVQLCGGSSTEPNVCPNIDTFEKLWDAIKKNKGLFGVDADPDKSRCEEKLGLQLAEAIQEAIKNGDTIKAALATIELIIDDCLDGLILKSEGTEFKPTSYTIELKKAIKNLSTAVAEKLKGKAVSLKDLETVATGFKVDKYKAFIKASIEEERRILALPLILKTLLSMPGDKKAEEYTGTLNVPGLTSGQAAQLNKIRKEYQKGNATMHPATAG